MEEQSPPIPSLLPEILLHILLKLPFKSVHKCKLVSKEWLSLISDPFFMSNYNPYSVPNHPPNLIMIPKHNKKLSPTAYNEINAPRVARPQPIPWYIASRDHVEIIGSCNGLVALYRHPGIFCLFNPCTAADGHITVHVPIEEDEFRPYHCVLYGLCYDHVENEYKAVVCALRSLDVQSFYAVNFKKGSWMIKTQPQMQNIQSWRDGGISGTIVNNVPYWICKRDTVAGECYLIFLFDSKKEEFIEAPRVGSGEQIWGLGTLDGRLTASLKSEVGLEVWGLKEHGNGAWCWSMMFVIAYKSSRSLSTLTWMVEEDEILVDVNEQELMVYNVRDGRLRQLKKRMSRSCYNMLAYLPSFISPL